jgi:heme a synthase
MNLSDGSVIDGSCGSRGQRCIVPRAIAQTSRMNRDLLTRPEPSLARDVPSDHQSAIRLWLYAVAVMVLVMVLVGGGTRLTESGLSITEWQPLIGALPPMSEAQWLSEFHKYQAIPQYRELNQGMSLDAFKTIFWWEWTHRLIGRLIGAVFLLPLLWFAWRGWIGPGLRRRLWLIFGLGGLQGGIGWWMVASGLVHRVEVSQYRLATHLVLACVIYIATLWTALRLRESRLPAIPARLRASAIALLILVLVQIYFGALVAGLRAGYIYNTWPLIDGALVPDAARLFSAEPGWRNFFENALTVQFDHRMLAYAIWLVAAWHLTDVIRNTQHRSAVIGALALFVVVTLQAALGISTLLLVVPLPLALLHQAVAMVALTVAVLYVEVMTRHPSRVFRDAIAIPVSSRT